MVRSAISAGVNTAVYGGSFGQAFAGGLVKDAAVVAANGIGGSEHTPEGSLSNVAFPCAAPDARRRVWGRVVRVVPLAGQPVRLRGAVDPR